MRRLGNGLLCLGLGLVLHQRVALPKVTPDASVHRVDGGWERLLEGEKVLLRADAIGAGVREGPQGTATFGLV